MRLIAGFPRINCKKSHPHKHECGCGLAAFGDSLGVVKTVARIIGNLGHKEHLMRARIVVAAMATVAVLGSGMPAAAQDLPQVDCSQYDVVRYSPAEEHYLDRIEILTEDPSFPSQQNLDDLESQRTPHGTGVLHISRPDTTVPPPWVTHLYITGDKARPISLEIVVRQNASYEVQTRWINEKLLWFSVWWGRILATEVILNVETGTFEYAEDANYGRMIQPCPEATPRSD